MKREFIECGNRSIGSHCGCYDNGACKSKEECHNKVIKTFNDLSVLLEPFNRVETK